MERRVKITDPQHQTFTETPSMYQPSGYVSFRHNRAENLFVPPNLSSDQTLESAFSRLNLSSPHHHHQPPFFPASLNVGDGGSLGPLFDDPMVDMGFLSSLFDGKDQTHVRFDRFHMGGGFGGAHLNPIVGPESFVSPSTSIGFASESRYRGDSLGSCSEFNLRNDHGYFLQRKKPLGRQFGAQVPNLARLNRDGSDNNFMGNFDGQLSGFVPNNEGPNSYSGGMFQVSQQFNLLSLEDLKGWIVVLAKEEHGCRILQMKFEDPKEEEIEMVLSEVIDYVVDLMKNQFGNHLIQKLLGVCNEEQRTRVILSMTKTPFQLIVICRNPHGARVVQKLLEHLSNPQQISLVLAALTPGAATLSNDPIGHHVIQHCLINFTTEYTKHLINKIAENAVVIATDKCGCCVLQLCVEHSQGEPRERLLAEITANAVYLAEHPYGNYVIQHLLGLRIPKVTTDLLRCFEGSYVSLSCNKYASNVVEKCLTESGEEHSTLIIMEFLTSPDALMLLLDPFGNFVIQSALLVSKGLIHNALVNLVRVHAPSMRSNPYGKKVLARFDKRNLQHV